MYRHNKKYLEEKMKNNYNRWKKYRIITEKKLNEELPSFGRKEWKI